MAYPTVSATYGFKPVNLLGGQVYAGSTRQMAIASGHATNIFFGDVVIMSTNGCITGCVTTSSAVNVAGIFMGCSYVNSSGQRVFGQYYPATISNAVDGANATTAYVADDPDLVMKVAIQSAADAAPSASQAARSALVGGNVSIVYQTVTGSTVNGDGTQGVLNAGVALSTAPIKIIDVVSDTSPATGSFVEVLVTWNQNIHMYRSWTGLA
tara:strand:- start:2 stop:634 length:633 start_codon:yes stop_codon:yes gene_type:complete